MTATEAPQAVVGAQLPQSAGVRYFEVNGNTVRGDSGQFDTNDFANELTVIQKYAQRLGSQIGARSISHGLVSGSGRTMAFEFSDEETADGEADLHGLMADRRLNNDEALTRIHRRH